MGQSNDKLSPDLNDELRELCLDSFTKYVL